MCARRGGFTLIELLIVVVILGLAAGVAVPALRPADGPAVAARQLAIVLRTAQTHAVRHAVSVRVTVDAARGGYRVTAERAVGDEEVVRGGALTLERGAALRPGAADAAVVWFAPTGTARGGPILITGHEHSYVVAVNGWTGAVSVRRQARLHPA